MAKLSDLIQFFGSELGLSKKKNYDLSMMLPNELSKAVCFWDSTTNRWRYDFGVPLNIKGHEVQSHLMYPDAEILFKIIHAASKRLDSPQLSQYLKNLDTYEKHREYLFEFAPIIRMPFEIEADYEPKGYGNKEKKIDWLIKPEFCPKILIEVKNRLLDIIKILEILQEGIENEDIIVSEPNHDTELLLRSVESKFEESNPVQMLQGVWIGTQVKQEKEELKKAFYALDRRKVHFLILGDFKDDVYAIVVPERNFRNIFALSA